MLGNALCKYLGDKGDVYAFHRDERPLIRECQSVSVDLHAKVEVKNLIKEISPDLLIHCAGLVNIDRCEDSPQSAIEQNVLLTKNVVQALEEKTKVVYISSDQVYGDISPKREEQQKLTPKNVYGETKLAGEGVVLSHSPKNVVIRTNVIGVRPKSDHVSFAEWVMHALHDKQPIPLFTDYIFSPIYGPHLGGIIWRLFGLDFRGIINVGSLNPCSKYEFGRVIATAGGFDESMLHRASIEDLGRSPLRPKDISLNVDKLISLGITPPTYQESARKVLKDYLKRRAAPA